MKSLMMMFLPSSMSSSTTTTTISSSSLPCRRSGPRRIAMVARTFLFLILLGGLPTPNLRQLLPSSSWLRQVGTKNEMCCWNTPSSMMAYAQEQQQQQQQQQQAKEEDTEDEAESESESFSSWPKIRAWKELNNTDGEGVGVYWEPDPFCDPLRHEFCVTPGPSTLDLTPLRKSLEEHPEDLEDGDEELILALRITRASAPNVFLFSEYFTWDFAYQREKFVDAKKIGWYAIGGVVNAYQIGLIVEDIYNIDYLAGTFQVDIKVFLLKIQTDEYNTWDYIDEGAVPLQEVAKKILVPAEETIAVREKIEETEDYYKLLNDKYEKLFGDGSQNTTSSWSSTAARRLLGNKDAGGGRVEPVLGTCKGGLNTTMLSMEDYSALGTGLEIGDSSAKLEPVSDTGGNLAYLRAQGATIGFAPVNKEFYPFQMNLLDIDLKMPGTISGLTYSDDGNLPIQNLFCMEQSLSGFQRPLKSVSKDGEKDFLFLVSYLKYSYDFPWTNTNGQQFRYGSAEDKPGENPTRITRSLAFRIIWSQPNSEGWMVLFPYLFSAFATQLQWLVIEANKCSSQLMVSAILLIQNVVNSQAAVAGDTTIVSKVIYLTYGITGVYITAVATMTFINMARDRGSNLWLVQHQTTIFQYQRLFGLLLSLFFIPLFVYYEDKESGYQNEYNWLWWLVGGFAIAIWLLFIFLDYRRRFQRIHNDKMSVDASLDEVQYPTSPVPSWSVEDVRSWIRHCPDLKSNSTFTEGELEAIAEKFNEAKVNGNAFSKIASDAPSLVKYLGLTIGEALHFAATIEVLVKIGLLEFDHPSMEQARKYITKEDQRSGSGSEFEF